MSADNFRKKESKARCITNVCSETAHACGIIFTAVFIYTSILLKSAQIMSHPSHDTCEKTYNCKSLLHSGEDSLIFYKICLDYSKEKCAFPAMVAFEFIMLAILSNYIIFVLVCVKKNSEIARRQVNDFGNEEEQQHVVSYALEIPQVRTSSPVNAQPF